MNLLNIFKLFLINRNSFLFGLITLACSIEFVQAEIIVDADGSDGIGRWRKASGASNHYGARSYYATTGSDVSYTLSTAPLTESGLYKVYIWNSCYSPRANSVPHFVGSKLGNISTDQNTNPISLNQDCDTGTAGRWQDLGSYNFDAGAEAYVRVSDTGLSSGDFIGVDAARFVLESSTPGVDLLPPVITNGSPSGSIFSSGTSQQSISVMTNENAVCRYSTNSQENFSSMTPLQVSASGLEHSSLIQSLQDGTSYQFYIKCRDIALNINASDYSNVFFSIESPIPADITPPQVSAGQPAGTVFPSGTSQVTISVNTDEVSSCAYSVNSGLPYSNMSSFSNTSNLSHSTVLPDLSNGETYTYFIKCRDTSGNVNSTDYEDINFSINEDVTPEPQAEIIVDANGSDGIGSWRKASGASNHYGARSYYATTGSDVSYTLSTAPLTESGLYKVYIWNSCYSPRANNVPHFVGSKLGNISTDQNTNSINLNQDCDTGIAGRWQDLGSYNFDAGVEAYVRVSDIGLSSGSFIGVDAARFVLESSTPGVDTQPPVISNGLPSGSMLPSGTSQQNISVTTNENAVCRYSTNSQENFPAMTLLQANANGREHSTLIQGLQNDSSYQFYIKCRDNALNINTQNYEAVFFNVESSTNPPVNNLVSDSFSGTGDLLDYTTTNPDVLPNVGRVNGRYRAELTDNAGNKTLHFHQAQGRLDAKLVTFPFEYIARNIGIGTLTNSQQAPTPGFAYIFSGVQVHSTNLSAADSAHVVVGHRGGTRFTVEGKNTVNGSSTVNDIGGNTVPDGRADIRVVGNSDGSLTIYWQRPNLSSSTSDNWQLYRGTGQLPGTNANFGQSVYIGLITYASGSSGVPFVGTCDSVQLVGE